MRSAWTPWFAMLACAWATSGAAQDAAEPTAGAEVRPAESVPGDAPAADAEILPTIPADAPPAPAPPGGSTRLDDVVVTATKFRQSAREIAGGITVLGGDDLALRGYQDANDFLKLVPGVNLTGGDEGNDPKRITIRGVSNISGTTMTSGTFWGDVPFSDPFIARVTLDPNAFDLETVEVLKGPQGTLFGATALNGALRYVPVAPEIGRWALQGYAQTGEVEFGEQGTNYGAALNVPMGDDAALRAVGFGRSEGGYTDEYNRGEEDVNRLRQEGYRGLLAWDAFSHWRVDLRHAMQDTVADDVSFADNLEGRLERGNTPIPGPVKTKYEISSVGLTRPFAWAELFTQTARTHKNFDTINDVTRNFSLGGPVDPLVKQMGFNQSTGWVHETRLVSDLPESSWKWVLGVFGSRVRLQEHGSTMQTDNTGDTVLEESDIDVTGDEIALFGQLRYAFADNWEAALGARAFRTAVYGTVQLEGPLVALINNGDPSLTSTGRIEEEYVNPSLSLSWTPTRDVMAFLAAARGFRFGGLNPLSSDATVEAPRTFKSDLIDNLEFGLRTRWFDASLQVDVGVYRLEWKDPQLFQQPEMSFSQYIDNVGGAEGEGVEAALLYRPPFLPGLSLSSSAAWSATETSEPFDDVSGRRIEPGTQWPFAPRFQSASTLDYVFGLGPFDLRAGLVHTSIGPCFTDLTHSDVVMDFETLDFNLNLSSPAHPTWPTVTLTVNNLRDERGYYNIESLGDGSVEPIDYSPTYIRPRTATLRLGLNF